jgi:hypothetical protein
MAFARNSPFGGDDLDDPIPLPTPGLDPADDGTATTGQPDPTLPFEPTGPYQPPAPAPKPADPAPAPQPDDQDATPLPTDMIGDIPPPPIPPPPPITGVGVAGIQGTEGSSFARPGTPAGAAFRTSAFYSQRPQRFGPGVPVLGGANPVPGLEGAGLDPDDAAELLAALAAGRRQ